MPAKWKNFSDEEIANFVKQSQSYRDVANLMGYGNGGSIITTLKAVLSEKNIDTSHFLGQASNKGKFDYERFKYGNNIRAANMKEALVALKGHQCETCHLSEWQNQPIPLEVHHKDGDHLNNELENLSLLCPNCHALTENWRGKNIAKPKTEVISDDRFVTALQGSPSVRQALLSLGLTGAGGNYERAYKLINEYNILHLKKNK